MHAQHQATSTCDLHLWTFFLNLTSCSSFAIPTVYLLQLRFLCLFPDPFSSDKCTITSLACQSLYSCTSLLVHNHRPAKFFHFHQIRHLSSPPGISSTLQISSWVRRKPKANTTISSTARSYATTPKSAPLYKIPRPPPTSPIIPYATMEMQKGGQPAGNPTSPS